ncbi:neuromedin-B [Microcaecilia unicolor]|uniref:Neuromedin-B n=1 Tax=Microcaecilia unicolor TaxID=1415580 RepID=A0A6P7X165_9AMPH|nr:neuromedin-B [Microcaecilia unicolor]
MPGLPPSRLFQLSFLAQLLLFSFISVSASVSLDVTKERNKVAKLKVNPRGNLWATGHFMGKKSIPDSPVLQYPEEAALSSVPLAYSPAHSPEDLKELLVRELLKNPLQQRQLDESRVKFDLNDQASELLMKILEKYVENTRK